MFKLARKYWLIIFLALGLVACLYLLLQEKPALPLTIQGSTPADQQTGVDLFAPISVTFNSALDPNLLSVTSLPPETWTITPENASTYEFAHKLALSPSTKYLLTFTYQGQSLSLTFTTQKSQGDPRLIQTIKEQMSIDYPLANLTPYETNLYRVVYSAPLTLEITLKTAVTTSDQAIAEIKSWVRNHGGDSSTHQYIVTR